MENFNFYAPTKMMFGRGKAADLPGEMNPFGSRVLLVYGGGSIRKNGIYEAVCGILRDHGFTFFELSGVTPNPKIESVREGVRLARENRVDMVLAVGGGGIGSVIYRGIRIQNMGMILSGTAALMIMAIFFDTLMGWIERRMMAKNGLTPTR